MSIGISNEGASPSRNERRVVEEVFKDPRSPRLLGERHNAGLLLRHTLGHETKTLESQRLFASFHEYIASRCLKVLNTQRLAPLSAEYLRLYTSVKKDDTAEPAFERRSVST